MTVRKRKSELASRLAALNISGDELAAILRRPAEDVAKWIDGGEPDAEAKILLRLIMDPERTHAAGLAAERVRHMATIPLRGNEDACTEGIEPPYGGGYAGTDAGRPE